MAEKPVNTDRITKILLEIMTDIMYNKYDRPVNNKILLFTSLFRGDFYGQSILEQKGNPYPRGSAHQ